MQAIFEILAGWRDQKFTAGHATMLCVNPTWYSPHGSLARFKTCPARSSKKDYKENIKKDYESKNKYANI